MPKLSSLVIDMQIESAELRKGLDEANAKIDGFVKDLEGGLKNRMVSSIQEAILSLDILKRGAAFAFDALKTGFEGMMADEKGVNLLSNAMKQLGYNADALVPMFEAQTEALEKSTLVDGNTIRQIQQLMVQFGMAPSAIGPATQAVLDYSAATGKNGVAATQQLLSAVTTGKDEIAKMGISFETTGDKTKDMVAATDALSERFSGSASAATKGLAGDMGRLQKANEDLDKAFAGFLAHSGIGQAVLQKLTDAFDDYTFVFSQEAKDQEAATDRADRLSAAQEDLAKATGFLKNLTEQQRHATASWQQDTIRYYERLKQASEERIASIKAEQAAASAAVVKVIADQNAAQADADRKAKEKAERERRAAARQAAREAEAKAVGQALSAAGRVGDDGRQTVNEVLQRQRAMQPLSLPNLAHQVTGGGAFGTSINPDLRSLRQRIDESVAEFGKTFSDSLAAAGESISHKIYDGISGLSDVVNAAQQGFSMGGPIGAVVAAFGELASKSTQFQTLMGELNEAFQAFADVAGVVIEPLLPLASLVTEFASALKPVVETLLKFSLFDEIIGAITWAFKGLSTGVLTLAHFLSDDFGNWDHAVAHAMEDMRDHTKDAADGARQLGEAAMQAAEIINMPSGFKVAAYRLAAQSTGGEPTAGGVGGGGASSGGAGGGGTVDDDGGRIGAEGPIGKGPRGGPIGHGPIGRGGDVGIRLYVDRNLNVAASISQEKYRSGGSQYVEGPVSG